MLVIYLINACNEYSFAFYAKKRVLALYLSYLKPQPQLSTGLHIPLDTVKYNTPPKRFQINVISCYPNTYIYTADDYHSMQIWLGLG